MALVFTNPYLHHLLLQLRDRETDMDRFRDLLEDVGRFMAYEMAEEFPKKEEEVITPLGEKARGPWIQEDKITVVAVLRAAFPMAYGFLKVLKRAKLGVVGAKRVEDEEAYKKNYEFEIIMNYENIPENPYYIVVDPMFASGSTLERVLERIYERKPEKVLVATLISTPFAIDRIEKKFPDARIYTVAVDEKLDERGYIVPGLGDAGDRAFG